MHLFDEIFRKRGFNSVALVNIFLLYLMSFLILFYEILSLKKYVIIIKKFLWIQFLYVTFQLRYDKKCSVWWVIEVNEPKILVTTKITTFKAKRDIYETFWWLLVWQLAMPYMWPTPRRKHSTYKAVRGLSSKCICFTVNLKNHQSFTTMLMID